MAEKVRIEFELKLGQRGVGVSLNVPAARVEARRMLPVFQGLAGQVVDAAVAEAAQRGETVSCKEGCSACCLHIVPVSRTEARGIRALVDAMPEPRRSEVRARFARAVAELETEGMLAEVRGFDKLSEEDFRALNRRHFALRTPCPFLEEGSCSIYAQRPLVCREYLVTSPAERCSDPSPTVRRLPLGSFVSYAVTKLESADPTDSRLALVLALEWTEAHAGEDQTLRPATEWIEKMLEGMTGKPLPGPGAGT